MKNILIIDGIHNDERKYTNIIKKELAAAISAKYKTSEICQLDAGTLLEDNSRDGCRFKLINAHIYDLNRISKNQLAEDWEIEESARLLIENTQQPENLLGWWIEECQARGLNLEGILQGSQSIINGFFGYTSLEILSKYEAAIDREIQRIQGQFIKGETLIIDLHSGMGKCGQCTKARDIVVRVDSSRDLYFPEVIAKKLLSDDLSNIRVVTVEVGTSTTYTHMTDVVLEITGNLTRSTKVKREEKMIDQLKFAENQHQRDLFFNSLLARM